MWLTATSSRTGTVTVIEYPTTHAPTDLIAGPDGNIWFGDAQYHSIVGKVTPDGKVSEYPLDISSNLVIGADGNFWFTAGSNLIKQLTPSGAVNSYSFTTAYAQSHEMLAGTDGNIWFTDLPGKQIVKVMLNGTVIAYPLPDTITLNALAMGADGNIWFAKNDQRKIVKMTPNGSLTEYAMPRNGFSLEALVRGADGNLWFTDRDNHQIGKITPNGVITVYATPTPASYPQSLMSNPDGTLWFVERWTNKIGKITLSGEITEYPIPFAKGVPTSLALSKDGNLWFSDEGNNAIGQSTPSGSMTEYPIPTSGSSPSGILATADGKIWFTEKYGNKVGSILFDNYIESSVRTADFGQSVTFTATVKGNNATGSVQFMDGANPIGKPITLNNNTASLSTSTLTVGSHNITAIYSGDARNASQTLSPLLQIVNPVPLNIVEFSFLSEQNAPTKGGSYRDPLMTLGADGNIWFIDAYLWANLPGIASIDKISPDGTITAYPISLSHRDGFDSMLAGPDGNVLVFKHFSGTGLTTGSIFGISPSGNIRTYYTGGPIEFNGYKPEGSILFRDCNNGASGEISADSKVSVTPFPGPSFYGCVAPPLANNNGITGPDANTWTIDRNGNAIVKTSPTGVVMRYTLPKPESYPFAIIAGADGNIWFTESVGKIGKIILDHVSSSLNPARFGQAVTLTAKISGANPTGTLQFMDGKNPIGSAIPLSNGVATFTTSALSVGSHQLTAVYSGDANNTSQTLSELTQVISAAVTPSPSVSPTVVPTQSVTPSVVPTTPTPTPTPVAVPITPVISISPSISAAPGTPMTVNIASPQADASYQLCYGSSAGKYGSPCMPIKSSFSFKMPPHLDIYGAVKALNAQGKSSSLSNELHVTATDDDVTWDENRHTASIRDVKVGATHYRVKLILTSNPYFGLQSTEILSQPHSKQPADYDDNKQDLNIPLAQVNGRYYQVTLHNIGKYSFRLDRFEEVK